MSEAMILKSGHVINKREVYTLTSNAKEAEVEQFSEDLQDLLELTPKLTSSFH